MKILVIGSRVPWPLKDGGAIATYGMLKGLAEAGAEVTLFTWNTRKHHVSAADISEHLGFCKVRTVDIDTTPTWWGAVTHLLTGKSYNLARFYRRQGVAALQKLIAENTYDVVQFEGLYATPLLEGISAYTGARVLRQHNAEFMIWQKLAAGEKNPLKKWYYARLAGQLKEAETAILRKFDAIIPITAEDEALFRELHPEAAYHLMPVGVQVNREPLASIRPNNCFHIGSMEWLPNIQGVQWLLKEVWPLVLKTCPDAVLHLAGKGLKADDPAFSGKGIVVHGEVADAAAFMESGGIMCVPVLAAGGIRVKILEAMAAGIPVVSTLTGASGIGLQPDKQIRLADTPSDFASALTELFQHPENVEVMRMDGFEFIRRNYSLSVLTEKLLNFYRTRCLKA